MKGASPMVFDTGPLSDRDIRRMIDEQVLAGPLPPDGRIPAERNIAERLGCSRAQVRRVMAELEREGRVVREVGRGTFLAPEGGATSSGPGASFAPAAIMTASLLFEPEVVSLAALAATEEDFAELQRCLERGSAATDYESFEKWDISLHHAFAVATHNTQIVAMVDVLNSTRNNPVWGRLKRDGFTPQNRAAIEREHHEIVEALLQRDRRRAASAMTEHLRFVSSVVTGQ
ncbi:FadR/GntR family transcriptional regulator [Mycolicibacterium parafortuitum]|uniref:FadR/GntR family transcriptional regulator n=1 Tax=Mycolicibacterium parafortuitum TaxID=39692 RepID=UPI000CF2B5BF|nr:FadR family transcriptional regulator [Mycobacterium sp. EPG1]